MNIVISMLIAAALAAAAYGTTLPASVYGGGPGAPASDSVYGGSPG
jgi:hypothetical protein